MGKGHGMMGSKRLSTPICSKLPLNRIKLYSSPLYSMQCF